jgi:4-oxalocrotonate tautomerase
MVQVTLVEGRSTAMKHTLIRELTDAVSRSLDVPADRVRIALYEVSGDDWGVGGVPYSLARGSVAAPDLKEQ